MTMHVIRTRHLLEALGGRSKQGRIVGVLRLRRGQMVPVPIIVDYVWGDRADGGPLCANQNVNVHVHRLRHRGVPIVSSYCNGRMLAA